MSKKVPFSVTGHHYNIMPIRGRLHLVSCGHSMTITAYKRLLIFTVLIAIGLKSADLDGIIVEHVETNIVIPTGASLISGGVVTMPSFFAPVSSSGVDMSIDNEGSESEGSGMMTGPRLIAAGIENIEHEVQFYNTAVETEMDEMKNLYSDLFGSYNPNVRPVLDQRNAVNVATRFVPITIIRFESRDQVMTVYGYFQFEWTDEVLANSTAFNGTLKISSTVVWTPPVKIAKATSNSGLIGDRNTDFLALWNRGRVQWVPDGIYSFLCEVNMRYYPFDVQTCTMTYYANDETTSTVNLRYHGSIYLNDYVSNAEWDLVSAEQVTRYKNNITYVDISFKVKRRGTFEAVTCVVPAVMMSLLNGLPYILPISSGEKGTLAVVMFIGYSIFMSVLVNVLPPSSLYVSHLMIYVIYLMLGSVIFIVYSIMQYKIESDISTDTLPRLFMRLFSKLGLKDSQVTDVVWWSTIFGRIDFFMCVFVSFTNLIYTVVLLCTLFLRD